MEVSVRLWQRIPCPGPVGILCIRRHLSADKLLAWTVYAVREYGSPYFLIGVQGSGVVVPCSGALLVIALHVASAIGQKHVDVILVAFELLGHVATMDL